MWGGVQPPNPQPCMGVDAAVVAATRAAALLLKPPPFALAVRVSSRKDGRRCGGKLVARPTDFSHMLDLHAAGHDHWGIVVELPALEGDETDTLGPMPKCLPAFTLPEHPGLVVFPAAVPPRQQLRLMQAALTQYPEPPAHTNHWAAYGPLVGVFAAAQSGLACKLLKEAAAAWAAAGPCSAAAGPPRQLDSCAADAAGEPTTAPAASSDGGCVVVTERNGSSDTAGPSACTFADFWGEPCDGGGSGGRPKASTLLRKLRWACLGPNFDWTRRVYDPALPHRSASLGEAGVAVWLAGRSLAGCRLARTPVPCS